MATQALTTQNGLGNHNLMRLAGLFADRRRHPHYVGTILLLSQFNVLPQPRKTFEGIHELSMDIAERGLITLPIVARFSAEDCGKYLQLVNEMWKTSFVIADVVVSEEENGEPQYDILIAGERRYRSCRHTWVEECSACPQCQVLLREGCEDCRERYGEEQPGVCYKRHFGPAPITEVEVRLCRDTSPVEALYLQFRENTHMRVPPHEEAKAYAQFFRLQKLADEKTTVTGFAREVGRKPDYVRSALSFCALPDGIQAAVERGHIPYGVALEIARIKKAVQDIKPEELEWWMLRAVTGNQKVPVFREVVTQYLFNLQNGQRSLLDIMTEEGRRLLEKRTFRKTVEAQTIQAIWGWIYYFGKVFQLFDDGLLGKADSPFSEQSPVKVFRKLLNHLEKVLPHMRGLIPAQEWGKRRQMLRQAQQVAAVLEAYIPETQEKETSLVTVG